MCGIAGILRFDEQPIDHGRLERMQAFLRHRGPDGHGIAEHGRCALVHTRLSIIDLLSGAQPMSVDGDAADGLHLVFNGEIYNHRALRTKLEKLGHVFRTSHSDTEVLLYGYRQWGDLLPRQLHGMFAFAIWDAAERKLVLCRDRTGQKPLYLWRRDGELIFGSLISAMVAGLSPGSSPEVNREALLTYLRLGYPHAQSMIDGVTEVPPAHLMTIDSSGETKTESYWRPPPISRTSTSMGAVDALREVLTESIHDRLEADVPLGCFLSGGVDSSVIAAMAQRRLDEIDAGPLKTYSVAMPHLMYDESEYAVAVARHIGAEHTVLHADPADAIGDLETLMRVAGEPTADSSILPTHWLCKAARRLVKAAISGDGGDELFGGYDRYRAMRFLDTHRFWVRLLPTGMFKAGEQRSMRTRFRRLIEAARVGREPAAWYRSMIHLFTDSQIAGMGLIDPPTGPRGVDNWPNEYDEIHNAMRWDLTHYLPHELLRKLDRASMAVGLEVRSPMLDTQVCDLAGHLPGRVLMPGNRPKGLLRALASEMLPMSIVGRPKQGFAVPIGHWFRGDLKDAVADRLFSEHLERFGIGAKPVRKLFSEHAEDRADHTHRLFALLQLAIWSAWMDDPQPVAVFDG